MSSASSTKHRTRSSSGHPHEQDPQFLEELLRLREDPQEWIERHLFIRTKEAQTELLRFNAAQRAYYEGRTAFDLILKARQLGFTTENCALFLADCLLRPNITSVIVAHDAESTTRIFRIVHEMWDRMPEAWKAQYPTRVANRNEIVWEKQNSRFFVGTAGSVGFGRGQTIQNLLCSELAHWPYPQDSLAALLEAVPASGRVVIESTPNGFGNYFHDLWVESKRGESEFVPFFFPWWYDSQYRLAGPPLGDLTREEVALCREHGLVEDQIRWRRAKQRLLRDKFVQEYPEDDVACFIASGSCSFSVPALLAMRERTRSGAPRRVDVLPYHRWYQGGKTEVGRANVPPGRLSVWREPEPGRECAIGADVAEGLAGGNYSAAVVLDRKTGEQVAELHGHWRPDVFARLLAGLSAWYNNPYLGVENNNHGATTLHVLKRELYYRRLYYHKDPVTRGKSTLGWPTNSRTKPFMIDELAAAIAEGAIKIRSPFLIDECLSFVSKDGGRQEAEEGKFDDLVIACAIAWQVRKKNRPRAFYTRPAGW